MEVDVLLSCVELSISGGLVATSIAQSRVFSYHYWHLLKVSKTPCLNPLKSNSLPISSFTRCPHCCCNSNSTKQTIKLRGPLDPCRRPPNQFSPKSISSSVATMGKITIFNYFGHFFCSNIIA